MTHFSLNAIILAAGFGTRLQQLGKNTAKGLFKNTQGLCLTDLILQALSQEKEIGQIALITNNHFYSQYEQHLQSINQQNQNQTKENYQPVTLINDQVQTAARRLGSLGDLVFALDELEWWDRAVLVTPSDRTPSNLIKQLIRSYHQHPRAFHTCVAQDSQENIRQTYGCAQLSDQQQIISFQEKPTHPKGNYRAVPYYIYSPEALGELRAYKQSNQNMDSPGNIIPWLLEREFPVYACINQDRTNSFDLGNLSQLEEFQQS
ncbi:MAG: NTP transferase domain-containing protein [Candidatus Pacebacteria bacterium]|nr:NTP transferase domain-containing protein [Candidatus Paceibacterota bacterium]